MNLDFLGQCYPSMLPRTYILIAVKVNHAFQIEKYMTGFTDHATDKLANQIVQAKCKHSVEYPLCIFMQN